MVKEFLSQKGVSYIEHDISQDAAAAQEVLRLTGQMAVPVTIVGGETIVGFDRARLTAALSREPKPQEAPRPSFGAAIADAGKITSRQGADIILGAYVGSVRAGSLAEKMGLVKGDIITEVNKQGISNAGDLEAVFSRMEKGSYITIAFLRGGQRLTAEGVLM